MSLHHFYLKAGDTISGDVAGGQLWIVSGSGSGSGIGGLLYVKGGQASSGKGGSVSLLGGNSTTGDGGNVTINGGTGGSGTPGEILMATGTAKIGIGSGGIDASNRVKIEGGLVVDTFSLSETALATTASKFAVMDSGALKYRTKTQMLADLGLSSAVIQTGSTDGGIVLGTGTANNIVVSSTLKFASSLLTVPGGIKVTGRIDGVPSSKNDGETLDKNAGTIFINISGGDINNFLPLAADNLGACYRIFIRTGSVTYDYTVSASGADSIVYGSAEVPSQTFTTPGGGEYYIAEAIAAGLWSLKDF